MNGKSFLLVHLLLITIMCNMISSWETRDEVTKLLKTLLKNYDKKLRPNFNEKPVEIGLSMRILTISAISELDMEFTVDMFFRQFWLDERLSYNLTSGIGTIIVGKEILEQIWVPDTYFVNEKQASFHHVTTQNTFVRMNQEGAVYIR